MHRRAVVSERSEAVDQVTGTHVDHLEDSTTLKIHVSATKLSPDLADGLDKEGIELGLGLARSCTEALGWGLSEGHLQLKHLRLELTLMRSWRVRSHMISEMKGGGCV